MTDEGVDYAKLSVDELIEVADHVDRRAFPQVAAIVDSELARRLTASPSAQPLEERPVNEADRLAFDQAIDRHLRWRRVVFLSWAGMLPLEMVVGWPLDKVTGSNVPFFLVAVSGMAAFSLSGVMLGRFKCPRCGQPFTRKRHFQNPFTSSCLNCGLRHSGR